MKASARGHTAVVQALLEHNASPHAATHDNQEVPLLVSSQEGHVEVVRLLLKHGANAAAATTDNGDTPLIMAAAEGQQNVVLLLLAADADPNQGRLETGETALMLASLEGHANIVATLLEAKADPSQTATDNGESALHMASHGGHTNVTRLLLRTPGFNPDLRMSTSQQTALFVAARLGNLEVVKLLCCYGASVQAGVRVHGQPISPLVIAKMCGNLAVHAWLCIVQRWTPLRFAAGARLHADLQFVAAAGLLDPDDISVEEVLAARYTAGSTDPFGFKRQDLLAFDDGNGYDGGGGSGGGGSSRRSRSSMPVPPRHHYPLNREARQHFRPGLLLEHVPTEPTPVCRITQKLVNNLTRGWSTRSHWYHNAGVRAAVHTLMLISERLHRQVHDPGEVGGAVGGDGGDGSEGGGSSITGGSGGGVGGWDIGAVDEAAEPVEHGQGTASVKPAHATAATEEEATALPAAEAVAGAEAVPAVLLPPEIWLFICSFMMRHWWDISIVKRAIVNTLTACRVCKTKTGPRHHCGGCMLRSYCSKRCQKKDWKGRHRHFCNTLKERQFELDEELVPHMYVGVDAVYGGLAHRFSKDQVDAGLVALLDERHENFACQGGGGRVQNRGQRSERPTLLLRGAKH